MTTLVRLLRAAGALFVLAAVAIGLPIALWRFGAPYLPDHVPALAEIGQRLTERDTGEVFLGFLIIIGFIAWAVFAASLALEIASLLRRRPVRGPRSLSWTRGIAAGLLSMALVSATGPVLASHATPLATVLGPPQPQSQTSTEPGGSYTAVAYRAPLNAPAAPAAGPVASTDRNTTTPQAGPSYTVRAGDSLWSIAAHHLGNPDRWEEIFALNANHPQDDGAALTDPAIVRPGWTLVLPTSGAAPTGTYTVVRGDTLSDIADHELDDPSRWDEVFEVNADRPQPDGHTLTDPNLIQPGWTLTLPPPATNGHRPAAAPQTPAPNTPTPNTPAPAAAGSTPDTAQATGGADAPAAPGRVNTSPTTASAPATAAPAPPDQSVAPPLSTSKTTTSPPTDADQPTRTAPAVTISSPDGAGDVSIGAFAVGISALAAAGLLTVLVGRRYLASRRRRPGHRMAHSQEFGPAETALRTTEDPDTVELLDLALRTLSAHLGAADQPLPTVLAATISDRQIGLRIAEPMPPVTPFTAGHTPVDWLLDTHAELLDPDDAADIPAPYPALATLGRTPTGELVLADLEAAGAITLTGDPDDIDTVLTALAVELAVSGWADHLDVALVGFGVRLAELLPDRLRYAADLDDALDDFARRAHQIRDALDGIATSSPDARGRGVADDAWIPSIILTAQPVTDAQQQRIRDLIELSPRSSLAAVIAADDGTHRLPGPWQIRVPSDPATPVPLEVLGGTAVVLQRCDHDTYRGVLDELARAGSTEQIPAGYPGVPAEPADLPRPTSHPGGSPPLRKPPGWDPLADEDEDDVVREFELELGLRDDIDYPLAAAPARDPFADDDHTVDSGPVPDLAPDTAGPHPESADNRDHPAARTAARATGMSADRPDDHAAGDTSPGVETDSPDHAGGPMLRLLGPITIDGVDPDAVANSKRNRLIELTAYLALHPGRGGDEVSHALGGSKPWAAPTRQSQMSRLRAWLGHTPDGEPLVSPVTDSTGYRLAAAMRCDWISFQRLARRGLATEIPDLATLERAMALVGGQPFTGAPSGRYSWADLIRHEMHATITDVAHTLGHTYLERGDLSRARTAVDRGLAADPVSELLLRDLCRIEYKAGDMRAIAAIADRVHRISDDLDLDPEPETTALLEQMLDPRRRSAPSPGLPGTAQREVWLPGPRAR